jgi:RNA polymerase sigma factor (TIGR02999 family)
MMGDATLLLNAIEHGDPHAPQQLLPLVYEELRKLAAQRLAHEKPGQTLGATALVHEAYLRLVGIEHFANRRHFYAAAAQAMRRILIDAARRKQLLSRVDFTDIDGSLPDRWQLLELNDALEQLATQDPTAARLVEVRLFGGLSVEEAADVLGVSRAAAYRDWTFARAWLATVLSDDDSGGAKR